MLCFEPEVPYFFHRFSLTVPYKFLIFQFSTRFPTSGDMDPKGSFNFVGIFINHSYFLTLTYSRLSLLSANGQLAFPIIHMLLWSEYNYRRALE